MITIQNADAALKDYYLDAVSAQLNDGISPFFSAIEKNADNVYGKDVKLAVVRGFSGNVMAGAEDGDLPDPYKNRYVNITAPLKNLYGTIEISDKALRASRDSSGAFVNLLNAEMEGLVSSAKQNFQRMLFGDGTGKLCKIINKTDNKNFKVDCAKQYMTGMRVDVYTVAGDAAVGGTGLFIESVNPAEGTVTVSAEVSEYLNNGAIYVHGSKDNELTGLGAIFAGNPSALMFSFTGGIISMSVSSLLMYLAYPRISVLAVSITSAVAHNVTQVCVYALVTSTVNMFSLTPYFVLLGILSGAIVGGVIMLIFKKLPLSVLESAIGKFKQVSSPESGD